MREAPKPRPAAPKPRSERTSEAAGDQTRSERNIERPRQHPQGAGGGTVAEDAPAQEKDETKRRIKRVLW